MAGSAAAYAMADEEGDNMGQISLKTLLEAGCHFGHQVKRWHPRAKSFIYATRDGIHIIDLAKTREGLENATKMTQDLAREGKVVLFVATKRQAKGVVSAICKELGIAHLTQRWIGGFLTNWDEVKKNLEKLRQMRIDRDTGAWGAFPKHEQVKLSKELTKLELFYGGVSELTSLPDAVFIVDIRKEDAAVREATIVGIPVIGIVDTNSDPTAINFPIPANDDAVGSIEAVTRYVAQSINFGKMQAQKIAAVPADSAVSEIAGAPDKKKRAGKKKETETTQEVPYKTKKIEEVQPVLTPEPTTDKKAPAKRGRKKKTESSLS